MVVNDRSVSGYHGEIRLHPEGLIYEDLKSTNGSQISREERTISVNVEADHELLLEEGDVVIIGDASADFFISAHRMHETEDADEDTERVISVGASVDVRPSGLLTGISESFDRAALLGLYNYSSKISGLHKLDAALAHFADSVLSLFSKANHVCVFVRSQKSGAYVPVLACDRRGPRPVKNMSRTLHRRVIEEGHAVLFTRGDPDMEDAESLVKADVQAGICAPLWNGEEIIGMAQVDRRGDFQLPFGEKDLETFAVFAHHLALSVSNVMLKDGLRKTVQKLERAQSEMERLAFFDPLTGLYNRRLFRDRLEQAVRVVERRGNALALLYLDLDDFKRINDTLGHGAGDDLLRALGERLASCVRGHDTVARIGGDEFAILLSDVGGIDGALTVAEKVLARLREPVNVYGQTLIVTTSIGITLAPEDGRDAETLLKNADLALYRAKSRGRNNFQFFVEDMNDEALDRLVLEGELRTALGSSQFLQHFQPLRRLDNLSLVGTEALLRWEHPTRGLLLPRDFMQLAEESGLIIPIGEWALRNACEEFRKARERGLAPPRLSVNLSARQFLDRDLVQRVKEILNESQIEPGAIELEITETMLMENLDDGCETLQELKELGVSLAIDDFGTGYSSLSYLKELPIDTLKVDRSFVQRIPTRESDEEIAAAVIAMAHKLRMSVVAEGIETKDQLNFLKRNQCEFGQGFYLGRPDAYGNAIT
ncbi:MAG: EAL domain-containing protein [Pseudomonadota bacterium]